MHFGIHKSRDIRGHRRVKYRSQQNPRQNRKCSLWNVAVATFFIHQQYHNVYTQASMLKRMLDAVEVELKIIIVVMVMVFKLVYIVESIESYTF